MACVTSDNILLQTNKRIKYFIKKNNNENGPLPAPLGLQHANNVRSALGRRWISVMVLNRRRLGVDLASWERYLVRSMQSDNFELTWNVSGALQSGWAGPHVAACVAINTQMFKRVGCICFYIFLEYVPLRYVLCVRLPFQQSKLKLHCFSWMSVQSESNTIPNANAFYSQILEMCHKRLSGHVRHGHIYGLVKRHITYLF